MATASVIPSRVFRPTDNNFADEISIALETLSPMKNGRENKKFSYEDENARDEFDITTESCK